MLNDLRAWLRSQPDAQDTRATDHDDSFITRGFAQEGEDLVLLKVFDGKPAGFYVDVGAHHPRRFSNTMRLYELGWRGINIEPTPGAKLLFDAYRPDDINLELAIGPREETLGLHVFTEAALNTFDAQLARSYVAVGARLASIVPVPVRPLRDVLSQHVPAGKRIDLLTIDAEGLDAAILRSSDWSRFRPRVVCVESLGSDSNADPASSESGAILVEHGYRLFAKTVSTMMFCDASEQPLLAPMTSSDAAIELRPVVPASIAESARPPFTIFALPKPFRGEAAVLQRNAIMTWTSLDPRPDVILIGNEEGIAEAAAEFGCRHVPEVQRSQYGTPRLDHAFQIAAEMSRTPLLCYSNADIIHLQDLVLAVSRVQEPDYLLLGRRTDVDLNTPIPFALPGWRELLRRIAATRGQLSTTDAIDYMVFSRTGPLVRLPQFLVGRPGWDNWFVWRARKLGLPVIDATGDVLVMHPRHGYAHVPNRTGAAWEGPEADHNRRIIGDSTRYFTIQDATHRLSGGVVSMIRSREQLRRRIRRLPALSPACRVIYALMVFARDRVYRPARRAAGFAARLPRRVVRRVLFGPRVPPGSNQTTTGDRREN